MNKFRLIFLLIVAFGVIRCGKEKEPPFHRDAGAPLQLEPQKPKQQNNEPKNGVYCTWNKDAAKYESSANVVERVGFDGNLYNAFGGGCVQRPIREAWAVLQNPDSFKWKDGGMDSFERGTETTAPFVFHVGYWGEKWKIRSHWKMDWLQSVSEGALEKPSQIRIRYQLADEPMGIKHWDGAIELEALSDTVTSFIMENHARGANILGFGEQIHEHEASGAVEDIFHNITVNSPNWDFLGR